MTVIMVYLEKPCSKEYNELLSMLDILFSTEIQSESKKKMLRDDFNVPMTRTVESEVSFMCNLSEGVYQKGIEKGMEKGIIQNMLTSIRNIVEGTGFTVDQAMNLLKIPDSEKPRYLELLKQE